MNPIIGCNIRKGMRPGFHTSPIAAGAGALPARRKTTATDVMKAAKAALERRGMHNAPTYFRDSRHESMFTK